MNVAVLEHASSGEAVAPVRESELKATGLQSEWIDPEGDDWLSAIYRELTQGLADATRPEPELEHWFG